MPDDHEEGTCKAPRKKGGSCSNPAQDDGYCWLHDESDGDINELEDEVDEAEEDDSEAEEEPEEELEAQEDVDLDEVQTKYVKVRNPDDHGKKAALIGFHPGEVKTMRNGVRVKRAIERGELEFIEAVPSRL